MDNPLITDESFDWPGYGVAELQHVRFGQERRVWKVVDGPRLVRYNASTWQVQFKNITTRLHVSAEAAIEAFNKKVQK